MRTVRISISEGNAKSPISIHRKRAVLDKKVKVKEELLHHLGCSFPLVLLNLILLRFFFLSIEFVQFLDNLLPLIIPFVFFAQRRTAFIRDDYVIGCSAGSPAIRTRMRLFLFCCDCRFPLSFPTHSVTMYI